MKVLFSFCLSFLFSLHLFAQHEGHNHDAVKSETPQTTKLDTALILLETTFDFGKIPQGKPVIHNFTFKNGGNTDLKLVNVQASCGCTTPEWEKDKSIAPNETSAIKVGYNAAAEGPFSKTITITYNTDQTRIITIKGEVWKTPSSSAPVNTSSSILKD
jgi:hypothetical protein